MSRLATEAFCLAGLLGVAASSCQAGQSNAIAAKPLSDIDTIRTVLATPESQIDFARAKLTFDKVVDHSINVERSLAQLDRMVDVVRTMAGPNASSAQRLLAVRRFLYAPGEWNNYRPFHYDMSDSMGTKIGEKLLPTYLRTHQGNCISMPMLFLVLADRLEVQVTASTAPGHVYVKYIDDASGKTYNIEATSGGYPMRDEYLRQMFSMSDLAVRNGVYMKTLSKREVLAVMADVDIEYFLARKRYEDAIGAANAALGAYPQFVPALLVKGTAYAGLIDAQIKARYPDPRTMPESVFEDYREYLDENRSAFEVADMLGWREIDGVPSNSSADVSDKTSSDIHAVK